MAADQQATHNSQSTGAPSTNEGHDIAVSPQSERARDAIVKSYRIVKVPDYFLDNWLPLLGPSRWLTALAFRQIAFVHKCKDKTGDQPTRTTYRELARWSGQSRPQMHKLLKDPELLTWFVRPDQGELGTHPRSRSERRVYLVRIEIPLTPPDQARLHDYLREHAPGSDEGWLQLLHGALEAKERPAPQSASLPDRPQTIQAMVRELRDPDRPLTEELDWACDELLERWQSQNFGQVTHYFIKKWLPELTPGLGCLLIWSRRHANRHQDETQVGQLRLSGWPALADAVGVSAKSVRRWFGDGARYPYTTDFMEPVPVLAGAGRIDDIGDSGLAVEGESIELTGATLIKDALHPGDFIKLSAERRDGHLRALSLELARESDISPGINQSHLSFDVKLTEPIHPDDQEHYQRLLQEGPKETHRVLRPNTGPAEPRGAAGQNGPRTDVDIDRTKPDKTRPSMNMGQPKGDSASAKVDNTGTNRDSVRTELETSGPDVDVDRSEVDALRDSLSTSQERLKSRNEEQQRSRAGNSTPSREGRGSSSTDAVVLHNEWPVDQILIESAIPKRDKEFILQGSSRRSGSFIAWFLWSLATKTIAAPALHSISRVKRDEQPPGEYCELISYPPRELMSWLRGGGWEEGYPEAVKNAIQDLSKAGARERLQDHGVAVQQGAAGAPRAQQPQHEDAPDEEDDRVTSESQDPVNDNGLTAAEALASAKGQLRAELPRDTFDTWVRDAELVDYVDGTFVIGVSNEYARDWLEDRLSSTIEQVLAGITGEPKDVMIVVR